MTQNSEMAGQSVTGATFAGTPRELPRVRLGWIVYVNLRSGNGGIVLDISEKGLALQTADRVGAGGPIHFRFLVPAIERVEVTAELIWIDETRKRGGLRFIDLPESAAEEIRRWIGQSHAGDPKDHVLDAPKGSGDSPIRTRDARVTAVQALPQSSEAQPAEEPGGFPDVQAQVDARKRSSDARAIDARMRGLDPQVRAAEIEAQARAQRRAEKQRRYETVTPADAQAQGRAEDTEEQDATASSADRPSASRSDLNAKSHAIRSDATLPTVRDGSRKQRIVLEPSGDFRNENRSASTFSTLNGGFAGTSGETAGESERARRGDFPEHVRGLYAQHMEDEEAPWHWSATLMVALVLGAAVALLGFTYKVDIGHSMVRLGQKISGMAATTQSARETTPPPPPGSESLPEGAASGAANQNSQANASPQKSSNSSSDTGDSALGAGTSVNEADNSAEQPGSATSGTGAPSKASSQAGVPGGATGENSEASAALQQSSGAPSVESSSRKAEAAPGAPDRARPTRESGSESHRANAGVAEAWKYAQQHPRTARATERGATGAATSETAKGETAGGGTGSREDNGQPELNLARQYLSQGNSAGAAEVLWLAVEKGNAEAEVQLADLYGRGEGVRKNCVQARVLVAAAEEKSDFLASNETARLNALRCK